MVKNAIENGQNLIVEGCYIPFSWRQDFGPEYLAHIRCRFLVMTRGYICAHADAIAAHACDMEERGPEKMEMEWLIRDNEAILTGCRAHGCDVALIDTEYDPAELLRQFG